MDLLFSVLFIGIFAFGFAGSGKWASRCFLGLLATILCYGMFSHPAIWYVILVWAAILLGKETFATKK